MSNGGPQPPCPIPEGHRQKIEEALAQGFEVAQHGPVHTPPPPPGTPCGVAPAFSERVHGFDMSLLGRCGPPDWRSRFENRLYDDDKCWVHLRRPRGDAERELAE